MQIDKNAIQFNIGINVGQAEVILVALSKLPIEQAMGLFEGIRSAAQQAVQNAEAKAKAEAAAASAEPVADALAESEAAE